ncbi:GspH/FimT family pseudopilin [Cellvibrio japonicus]|uniref:GspH/FimT family pseudopilin n=1 Tax=Cellvibrio japonicus TaxID=155077 RepID=UPI001305094B|nr:GspH/FimT family pseudopilin [Cellvibrio japonicus]
MLHNKGFTLIELMITVVILAIVAAIAIPSFNAQILNNRSVALGEDIVSAVNFVRSEAVKRATRVSICASNNGSSCTGSWSEGYIAFIDTAASDKASTPVIQDSSAILKIWPAQNASARISVKTKDSDSDVSFIRYTSMGTLARVSDEPVVIATEMDGCTGYAKRQTTVGVSGMISVESKECTVN